MVRTGKWIYISKAASGRQERIFLRKKILRINGKVSGGNGRKWTVLKMDGPQNGRSLKWTTLEVDGPLSERCFEVSRPPTLNLFGPSGFIYERPISFFLNSVKCKIDDQWQVQFDIYFILVKLDCKMCVIKMIFQITDSSDTIHINRCRVHFNIRQVALDPIVLIRLYS